LLIAGMYIARCIFIRLESLDRNTDEKFLSVKGLP